MDKQHFTQSGHLTFHTPRLLAHSRDRNQLVIGWLVVIFAVPYGVLYIHLLKLNELFLVTVF